MTTSKLLTQSAGALALAAASVATWWAWLGWDNEYQIDPVTKVASGPYEAWQVVGCGLAILVLAAAGGLLLRPWLVAPTMTLAFTTAWSLHAASLDETGLWGVGAFLLAGGMGFSTALVSFGAYFAGKLARRSSGGAGPAAVLA